MKLNRTSVIVTVVILVFVGLLMVVTIGSKDSMLHQYMRRLAAFKAVLPHDLQLSFDKGSTAEVEQYLQKQVDAYKAYTNTISPDKRIDFLKAEYAAIDKVQLQKVPKELLSFYSKYYAILDFECIQGFTVPETVGFFRKYFYESIDKIKKGVPVPDQN